MIGECESLTSFISKYLPLCVCANTFVDNPALTVVSLSLTVSLIRSVPSLSRVTNEPTMITNKQIGMNVN